MTRFDIQEIDSSIIVQGNDGSCRIHNSDFPVQSSLISKLINHRVTDDSPLGRILVPIGIDVFFVLLVVIYDGTIDTRDRRTRICNSTHLVVQVNRRNTRSHILVGRDARVNEASIDLVIERVLSVHDDGWHVKWRIQQDNLAGFFRLVARLVLEQIFESERRIHACLSLGKRDHFLESCSDRIVRLSPFVRQHFHHNLESSVFPFDRPIQIVGSKCPGVFEYVA